MIFICFLVTLFLCTFLMMFRNNKVYKYHQKLLEKIYLLNCEEIREGKFKEDWRRKEFSKISYFEMANKFWEPLNSFYNKDFDFVKKLED